MAAVMGISSMSTADSSLYSDNGLLSSDADSKSNDHLVPNLGGARKDEQ